MSSSRHDNKGDDTHADRRRQVPRVPAAGRGGPREGQGVPGDHPTRATPASGRWSSSGPWTSRSCAPRRSPSSGSATATSRTATPRCWASARTPTSCTWPGGTSHADLKDLPFPMLADTQARAVHGAGDPAQAGRRAPCARPSSSTPRGSSAGSRVNDLSVGRNVDEVLRVLDALQTDELCPCNWKKGEPTLEVGVMAALDDVRDGPAGGREGHQAQPAVRAHGRRALTGAAVGRGGRVGDRRAQPAAAGGPAGGCAAGGGRGGARGRPARRPPSWR